LKKNRKRKRKENSKSVQKVITLLILNVRERNKEREIQKIGRIIQQVNKKNRNRLFLVKECERGLVHQPILRKPRNWELQSDPNLFLFKDLKLICHLGDMSFTFFLETCSTFVLQKYLTLLKKNKCCSRYKVVNPFTGFIAVSECSVYLSLSPSVCLSLSFLYLSLSFFSLYLSLFLFLCLYFCLSFAMSFFLS
jgi:hypothetical protein